VPRLGLGALLSAVQLAYFSDRGINMAVQYKDGQLYDVYDGGSFRGLGISPMSYANSGYKNILGLGIAKPIGPMPSAAPPKQQGADMYGDPFGTAMSGTQKGTLQPFINRNTQLANNALYGGLLGYQPQQLVAGDAGGTPVNPTPPQWKLPSAIATPNQAQVGLLGPQAADYMKQEKPIFGNRAWMEY
jgi:hypothetical protein